MRTMTRVLHAMQHPVRTTRRVQQWHQGYVVDAHGFKRRAYPSYAHYLEEQTEKLTANGADWLADSEHLYEAKLRAKLAGSGLVTRGLSVLCLGARLGGEVRAFRALGAFAVGIDLNPGLNNDAVCFGDFHTLAYGDQSVGIVYTNAIDHVFDLTPFLGEIRRVLVPGGVFITETVTGNQTGTPYGFYDAMGWTDVEDVSRAIEAQGFTRQIVEAADDRGRHWGVFRTRRSTTNDACK